jgi:hypothetical protein
MSKYRLYDTKQLDRCSGVTTVTTRDRYSGSIGGDGMHQIVRLVLWIAPEVQELRAAWLIHAKRRLSIKLKRHIVKAKTVLDLRVTMLVHRFKTGAHILID